MLFNFEVFTLLDWVAFSALSVLLCTALLAWFDWATADRRDVMDAAHYERYVELAKRHLSVKDVLSYETVKYLKVATTSCNRKVLSDRSNNVVQFLGGA